jgi:hypothetical protein
MTQNLSHKAHTQPSPKFRTQVRTEAETLLRDLAFVFKMTERVRAEIEADQEAQEPVLV